MTVCSLSATCRGCARNNECEALSTQYPEISVKLDQTDVDVPVNFISTNACTFLVAAEESAARRADELDAGYMDLDPNGNGSIPPSALGGWHDLYQVTNMSPPRRFYRIVWESLSLQLLDRMTHTTLLPLGSEQT